MKKDAFTFACADGSVVIGPVQGCGGTIERTLRNGRDLGLERMHVQQNLAKSGERLGIYEPKPFHCSVHVSDEYPAGRVSVDLRTCVIS